MATRKVQALVLHGPKDLRLESHILPPPGPDEVQVALKSTGLCGSDLHYYKHYRNGDILVREPLCLGHESAGIVTVIGSSVTSLAIGDAVALEVGIPCSSTSCPYCTPVHSRSGTASPDEPLTPDSIDGIPPLPSHPTGQARYNLCPSMRFRSSAKSMPHAQGTLQSAINQPASWCHKLPSSVSFDKGALLEPLSVAIHAARRAQLPTGATVLIFGAGAVGLLCAYMARQRGAAYVVIADIDAGRIAFATKQGFADQGFLVPLSRAKDIDEKLQIARETAAELVASARVDNGGFNGSQSVLGMVDVVFECTGVEACVQTGIYATKPGGKVMLVGMGTPVQTLPMSAAALREVDLLGVFRYANTYDEGIRLAMSQEHLNAVIENGVNGYTKHRKIPDFESLVTHRFRGLENAHKAFEMAGRTVDDEGRLVLKVVVEMD